METISDFLPPDVYKTAGISLKNQHFLDIMKQKPRVGFFEIHAENFMSEGGNHRRFLEKVCLDYPLSIHGVGMSLGSAEGLSHTHLKAFKAIVDKFNPMLVSEHLAWSAVDGYYLNDLLPLPLTQESMAVVADNVNHMQDFLGRQILIENPSSYLTFKNSEIPEPDFLSGLVERTNCGLLLDVNNVYVSASNLGWNAEEYLKYIDGKAVQEIHLAGHTVRTVDGGIILIDDHGAAISNNVWNLFQTALSSWGSKPVLIEWDTNIPPLETFVQEADKASVLMRKFERASAYA
ncbi:MNIO family bufferin maturase [Kordiimonas pumila]|uniref:DUF692 family multinuclear iron-containing protein n=1 Tax=Kordiimonas pumila TaxID=2161677 RepID=A0ABV7D2R1_9PROT|nr:DUF692 domain-containing protein [Kordiimonas pumila]